MDRRYEIDRKKKKEAYLLASRNPWLVWRLQVLRMGYIPPLLTDKIPPDLLEVTLGAKNREHLEAEGEIHPDGTQAARPPETKMMTTLLSLLIAGLLLLAGLSLTVAFKGGKHHRLGLIDALLPRSEENVKTESK